MRDVYIGSDNIITSLGFTKDENAEKMLHGNTGISLHEDIRIAHDPFYASLVDTNLLKEKFSQIGNPDSFTHFEQLAIYSIHEALSNSLTDITSPRTLFILSTTKGNVDLLKGENMDRFGNDRVYLWNSAQLIKRFFKFRNEPVVISDACISGVQAIITGSRMIRYGIYDTVVINGTDIISEFVLSGFNSLKSLSTGPCRPFDKTRDGLSLGEGSGTIILSATVPAGDSADHITAGEGISTNDANHISGPSRTGEGLFMAIKKLLKSSSLTIDYISAHGTATLYNDEMESIAVTRAGFQSIPVNSYKGYWGHTLGAAGIIESIMCIYSIRHNILFNTLGYKENGVSNHISVIDSSVKREINNCLKIASGFGGCNAAILYHKR